MKKVLMIAAVAVLAATSAKAADLPARPYTKAPVMPVTVYDWSGFYVGGNAGWGSSRNCWDFTSPAGAFIAAEGCHDSTGGLVGGQVGYRWQQTPNWVFGLEAQGDWAGLTGRNVSAAFPNFANESKINAIGLFTGQVGFATNNVLAYVKGGAAVVSDRYNTYTVLANVLASSVTDSGRWGATLGLGVEYGLSRNWSIALEYDHVFLEPKSYTFLNNAGTLFGTDRIRQGVDLVTARVNYHFGAPVVAKY